MKDPVTEDTKTTQGTTRYSQLDPDKLRGGYYTPDDLATWVASWCLRNASDQALEPSCGDGSFLAAAARRLLALGTRPEAVAKQLHGMEIINREAAKAVESLESVLGVAANEIVTVGDFFEWWQAPGRGVFDAVIGNPPFIRYQSFPEPHRSRAMNIMRGLGLKPNRLTNSWVPFVVAAARTLNPGGRLGLILPAELLQVSYAAQVRSFLVEHFRDIHVVACNELFFEKAEQEVVVLLADGALPTSRPNNDCVVSVSVMPTRRVLIEDPAETLVANTPPKHVQHGDEKWLKYFLSQQQIDLLRTLRTSGVATTLDQFASVDVGVVTGKNEFFVLNESQLQEWQLQEFSIPLVGRAAHLDGAIFSREQWEDLSARGERVHLLQLGTRERNSLPPSALKYVVQGEEKAFHRGYKCSIRDPWYSVPSVWVPDALLFRQIYDFPRMIVNKASVTSTDTIHRMNVHKGSPEAVTAMCFTSLTAASAEIEGRSYGGGVLELEPTEAERLLVPASLANGLELAEIDQLIRQGRMSEVLDLNDKLILGDQLGLSAQERVLLRTAWNTMRQRRQSRRRHRANEGKI